MTITHSAQQAMAERRAIIAAEGLRTAAQVGERFGVSEPTARTDLRAVWGELPAAAVQAKPAAQPDPPAPLPICPHCGATFVHAQSLERHEPICVKRPGMSAVIRACLTDHDRPGLAVSTRIYRQRATEAGATNYDALLDAYGSWRAICAAYGLEPGRAAGYEPGSRGRRRISEAAAIREVEAQLEADARLRESLRDWGLTVCPGYERTMPDGRVARMLR